MGGGLKMSKGFRKDKILFGFCEPIPFKMKVRRHGK